MVEYRVHALTASQIDTVLSLKQQMQLKMMILRLRTTMKKKVSVLKYIAPDTEEYTQSKNKIAVTQYDPGYTYILVETKSGDIVGYMAYTLSSVSGIVQLTEMYIKEEYRGNHLLTSLEKVLVEHTVKAGCKVIEVNTYPDDGEAKYGAPSLCLQGMGYVNTSDIYTYIPRTKRDDTSPGNKWSISDGCDTLIDSEHKKCLYQCIKATNEAISSYGLTLKQAMQKSMPAMPTLTSGYHSVSKLKKGEYVPEFYFSVMDASPTIKFINAIVPTLQYGHYVGSAVLADIRKEFTKWFYRNNYEAVLYINYLNSRHSVEITRRQHCLEMLGFKRSMVTMYKEV